MTPKTPDTPSTPSKPGLLRRRSAPPVDPAVLPEISDVALETIGAGSHYDPHSVLGQHLVDVPGRDPVVVIRALRPFASGVTAVLESGERVELHHLGHGIWQGVSTAGISDYLLEAHYDGAPAWVIDDPYRYAPTLGELDLHLLGEGRHEQLWDVLGSHYGEQPSVNGRTTGTSFAVWAPHAQSVRVIGDFNRWNGVLHSMRTMGSTGVWELFVPGLEPGSKYKYEILSQDGRWLQKADPLARYTELPPGQASVVGQSGYDWQDDAWLARRAATDPHNAPMSIYEMHLGSWRPGLGYREVAEQLIGYLQELAYTHVEFMPLAEHPFGGSWGYQVTGYYAPTSRFGHPDDLRYLIDRLHQAGIGVIMDWVPGHFPKDDWALARFDGQALYEHPDPRRGEQMDWGTYIFDFGQPQVRNFLVANALYWLEEFHIDGLRVDAVASMLYLDYSRNEGEWLPNIHGGRENLEAISLLQEVTATSYRRNPGTVVIAEESTSWPGVTAPTSAGGLGFGLKWNMGWMHDSLQYMQVDPMYRAHHHNQITFSFVYAFSENYVLPISHDEVVHGKGSLVSKMPGDPWKQLANVRVYLAFMWSHPGKQLLFMGQEFGQRSEWSEERGLDWWTLDQPAHRGLFHLVAQLNRLYVANPALWDRDNTPEGFEMIDGGAANANVVTFLRKDTNGHPIACLFNFSGQPHDHYRVGLPHTGRWEEILNTDAAEYGGSGVGNLGGVDSVAEPWDGRPASAALTLPPLGALWLRYAADDTPATTADASVTEPGTASGKRAARRAH
ncbi:1,4-alpha-glucan branching protein GlgB [Cryobacterium tepidiphilum]|uniref:1,4-alpha-glucan branching enzyme GlgB n=1 Tax=Cryobacterium tepidiphilum TaxID=2486026 RepID=A0A3M8L2P3_9MICO|nr:1,4-alpha-glucan branching protein GlgB [Cryobacterium tepidiphilum]RNE59169.1 1,4-alpha-glucan branching protein GlgB [Cryobacterium tepidiphilum]